MSDLEELNVGNVFVGFQIYSFGRLPRFKTDKGCAYYREFRIDCSYCERTCCKWQALVWYSLLTSLYEVVAIYFLALLEVGLLCEFPYLEYDCASVHHCLYMS